MKTRQEKQISKPLTSVSIESILSLLFYFKATGETTVAMGVTMLQYSYQLADF